MYKDTKITEAVIRVWYFIECDSEAPRVRFVSTYRIDESELILLTLF